MPSKNDIVLSVDGFRRVTHLPLCGVVETVSFIYSTIILSDYPLKRTPNFKLIFHSLGVFPWSFFQDIIVVH